MPRHRETKTLPYSPEQMFDLVADIDAYPDFLPWCVGARTVSRSDSEIIADLVIGFKMFRERFRSKVKLERPGHLHVEYIRGPLKYLHNDWQFEPRDDGGTTVEFYVDFEFKNRLFEKVVGSLFSEAVHRMVAAFEKRAHQQYGPAARAASKPAKAASAKTKARQT